MSDTVSVRIVDAKGEVLLSKEMPVDTTILQLKEKLQSVHAPARNSLLSLIRYC